VDLQGQAAAAEEEDQQEDPQAAEQPEVDQQDQAAAAEDAEMEQAAATVTEATDEEEKKEEDNTTPGNPAQAAEGPKEVPPTETALCEGMKAVQVDGNEAEAEEETGGDESEDEAEVVDDENEEEDDGGEEAGEEETATQPHGPEMPGECPLTEECAGTEKCDHGGSWEEAPEATARTASFEGLTSWFRNAGTFHDCHGQPTGEDIPVLTLLKLPINSEKQCAKDYQGKEGRKQAEPKKRKRLEGTKREVADRAVRNLLGWEENEGQEPERTWGL
jgi:hypothetical protein